jgi:hypothetical protein
MTARWGSEHQCSCRQHRPHTVLARHNCTPWPTAVSMPVCVCAYLQVWGVGGKFGTSAAVGVVLPPAPQMVEKQGWSYVSRPNQLLRGAHEAQSDITSIAFSKVGHKRFVCVGVGGWGEGGRGGGVGLPGLSVLACVSVGICVGERLCACALTESSQPSALPHCFP